jgi:polyisoprenoid-binding protein YceI
MIHLLLLTVLSQGTARDSVVYRLAPASVLEVTTGKAGLFGFAGHEHTIRARAFTGNVVYYPHSLTASRIEITVPTDSLEVLTPPDTEEIRKVTASMRTEVLNVASFPEIRMVSQHIEGTAPHLTLMVALTIRGQTREVRIPVDVDIGADTVRARSVFKVKQTEFGIRPYRGGPGGTVRVADEVRFSIQVVAIR